MAFSSDAELARFRQPSSRLTITRIGQGIPFTNPAYMSPAYMKRMSDLPEMFRRSDREAEQREKMTEMFRRSDVEAERAEKNQFLQQVDEISLKIDASSLHAQAAAAALEPLNLLSPVNEAPNIPTVVVATPSNNSPPAAVAAAPAALAPPTATAFVPFDVKEPSEPVETHCIVFPSERQNFSPMQFPNVRINPMQCFVCGVSIPGWQIEDLVEKKVLIYNITDNEYERIGFVKFFMLTDNYMQCGVRTMENEFKAEKNRLQKRIAEFKRNARRTPTIGSRLNAIDFEFQIYEMGQVAGTVNFQPVEIGYIIASRLDAFDKRVS